MMPTTSEVVNDILVVASAFEGMAPGISLVVSSIRAFMHQNPNMTPEEQAAWIKAAYNSELSVDVAIKANLAQIPDAPTVPGA